MLLLTFLHSTSQFLVCSPCWCWMPQLLDWILSVYIEGLGPWSLLFVDLSLSHGFFGHSMCCCRIEPFRTRCKSEQNGMEMPKFKQKSIAAIWRQRIRCRDKLTLSRLPKKPVTDFPWNASGVETRGCCCNGVHKSLLSQQSCSNLDKPF